MTLPPSRQKSRQLLFSLVAVFLFFPMLEAAFRISGYQPRIHFRSYELPYWLTQFDPVVLDQYTKYVQGQGFVNEDVYYYSPDNTLGYVLKPGIRKTVKNYSASILAEKMPEWTIVSNDSGFRTGTDPVETGPGKSVKGTIHVLGDSSSFGWGVDYEKTYGYIFAKKINEALAGKNIGYELVNHSMPGFTSFQGMNLLERLDSIKPDDWVLVSFGWNDSYFSGTTDRKRLENRMSWIGRVRAGLNSFLFYKWMQSFWVENRLYRAEWNLEEVGSRVSLSQYRKYLDVIFDEIQKRGSHPVFVNVCNYDDYPDTARSVAEKRSVPFFDFPEQLMPLLGEAPILFPEQFSTYFDVYGGLMEQDESLVVLFPDGCHPNVIGHHLMGDIIFKTMKNEFGL